MGAHSFTQYQAGADMHAAYEAAVRDAQLEDGHSPYSGTIATSHGVVSLTYTPMTPAGARALAERLLGEDDPRICDKWGPCGAIPVLGDADVRTRTFRVRVRSDADVWRLPEVVREKAQTMRRDGEAIAAVRVDDAPVPRVRIVREPAAGRRETVYRLRAGHGGYVGSAHASIADARAEAEALLSRDHPTRSDVLAIVGEVRRVGGGALATLRRVNQPRMVRATVTAERPARTNARPAGYLFVGWAAS